MTSSGVLTNFYPVAIPNQKKTNKTKNERGQPINKSPIKKIRHNIILFLQIQSLKCIYVFIREIGMMKKTNKRKKKHSHICRVYYKYIIKYTHEWVSINFDQKTRCRTATLAHQQRKCVFHSHQHEIEWPRGFVSV